MSSNHSQTTRCVFGMEAVRSREASRSYLSVCITGDWDIDLLEALTEFVQRQRHRLKLADEQRETAGDMEYQSWA